MTTRRHFLESTLLAGGLAFTASAHAQGKTRYVDKLTDGAGKYARRAAALCL